MQCRSLLNLATLTAPCAATWPQRYPKRPVQLAVPYAQDGSADTVATAE
jgi:tripartite-type tricarboxylate transporter receptor subunit TctC